MPERGPAVPIRIMNAALNDKWLQSRLAVVHERVLRPVVFRSFPDAIVSDGYQIKWDALTSQSS